MTKNQYAQVVFLDVTKAYDTTWRRLILNRLSKWKIGGEMLRFLKSMLELRTFKVLANGTLSSEKQMETGLCQGSVLSVTMFLIAIDTIVEYLPENVKCLIYADDIVLIASGGSPKMVEAQLQIALNMIENWETETGFKISPGKSCTVIFRNLRTRRPSNQNTLNLGGTLVPRENSHRCLGVKFDQCLQFRKHAEEVRAACQQRIIFLRSIASRNWGGDRNTLIKLYRSTVLEKMLYAAPVISAMSDVALKRLETIHNTGLRTIIGAFHTSPIVSLQSETGIPNIRTLLELRTAMFTARSVALNTVTEEILEVQSEDSHTDSDEDSGELWGTEQRTTREVNTVCSRGTKVLQDIQVQLPELTVFIRPTIPPWKRSTIPVDKSLYTQLQLGANSTELRLLFNRLKSTKYRIHHFVYTDGSKMENRCGFSVVAEDLVIRRKIHHMNSIFTAESLAVKEALGWIAGRDQAGAYLICTDSLSVVTALGRRKISSKWRDEIAAIYKQVKDRGTEVIVCWVPSHIGITGNEKADLEAKLALDATTIDVKTVDVKEIKTTIKKQILWRWQGRWNEVRNNKLREIKNTVLPFTEALGQNRKENVKLSRLRIGHTALTHSYLLERTEAPRCQFCNEILTVKHIIVNCEGLNEVRIRIGLPANLREALADDKDRSKTTLDFFKEIRYYDSI